MDLPASSLQALLIAVTGPLLPGLQPSQSTYRSETAATAAAAVLAANAAAAAAAEAARKQSIERGGAGMALGKRKRKPRRDEDYVDPAGSEEDEELKGEWAECEKRAGLGGSSNVGLGHGASSGGEALLKCCVGHRHSCY